MVAIRPKISRPKDLAPLKVFRTSPNRRVRGFERGTWRIVAREMPGIDIQPADHSPRAQSHNDVVMTPTAPAAALPAIHPLAMIVKFVRDKYRVVILQHALHGSKEIITAGKRFCPEAGCRKIYQVAGKCRNVIVVSHNRSGPYIGEHIVNTKAGDAVHLAQRFIELSILVMFRPLAKPFKNPCPVKTPDRHNKRETKFL